MTRFIDVPMLSQLLSHVGEQAFIEGMAEYITSDFLRWPEFQKSARTAAHTEQGVIELMPIADPVQYGFKYVNGHPSNTKLGLSTVMAFGALANMDTGFPVLVSELTITTGFRTAVTSAIAAKALCKPEAKKMAMIGCGAQSEFQIIAFLYLLGINEVNIYDIDLHACVKLQKNLADKAVNITIKPSVEEALRGADIVSTATADKCWATILEADMIENGMHINAIGGDCPGKTELDKDILLNAKTFVEYEPQTRIEGEIQQLSQDYQVTELWEVLAGKKPGRDSADEVTVFDSVGFALEDYSALRYLYALSKQTGIGENIEIIPNLDNPKDLYSLVAASNSKSIKKEAS